MLCEKCGKNPATFHYTEVVNGVKSEHHLCAECAANTDVSYYSNVFDSDMNITELLAGLLGEDEVFGDNSSDPSGQSGDLQENKSDGENKDGENKDGDDSFL